MNDESNDDRRPFMMRLLSECCLLIAGRATFARPEETTVAAAAGLSEKLGEKLIAPVR